MSAFDRRARDARVNRLPAAEPEEGYRDEDKAASIPGGGVCGFGVKCWQRPDSPGHLHTPVGQRLRRGRHKTRWQVEQSVVTRSLKPPRHLHLRRIG